MKLLAVSVLFAFFIGTGGIQIGLSWSIGPTNHCLIHAVATRVQEQNSPREPSALRSAYFSLVHSDCPWSMLIVPMGPCHPLVKYRARVSISAEWPCKHRPSKAFRDVGCVGARAHTEPDFCFTCFLHLEGGV